MGLPLAGSIVVFVLLPLIGLEARLAPVRRGMHLRQSDAWPEPMAAAPMRSASSSWRLLTLPCRRPERIRIDTLVDSSPLRCTRTSAST